MATGEPMDFTELTLAEQVDIVVMNASGFTDEVTRLVLLCIASKLGEMCSNNIDVYWAYQKGDSTNKIFENDGERLFYIFTSRDRFLKIPEKKRALLEIEKTDISIIIKECLEDTTISGIAIDPFVNEIGFFFADRDIVILAC